MVSQAFHSIPQLSNWLLIFRLRVNGFTPQSAKETSFDFWLIASICLFPCNLLILKFTTQPQCLGCSFNPVPLNLTYLSVMQFSLLFKLFFNM